MALILAIEPDRRQAGQLTAIVKGRLHAEFVIGDSAETALAALGARVPDLVLTTALLSPKDETALSERLRALDGAAAHVQTLTIPVLATSSRRRVAAKAGGVLSALLGDKSGDDPATAEGCDPAMFAEQCKEYLERAAADRADALENSAVYQHETQELDAPEVADTDTSALAAESAFDAGQAAQFATATGSASDFDVAAPPDISTELADPAAALPEPVVPEAEPPAPPPQRRFLARLSEDEPPATLMAAVAALADAEEQVIYAAEPAAAAAEDTDLTEEVLTAAAEEPAVPVYDLDTSDFDRASFEIDETPQPPAVEAADAVSTRPEVRTWPILEEIATAGAAVDSAATETSPESPAVERSEFNDLRDWKDIIEALRRDAEPISFTAPVEPIKNCETPGEAETVEAFSEPAAQELLAAEPPAPEPVEEVEPETPPARRKGRRKPSVEDEWGFYDPDRAGFAALLAKLEEITEEDTRKPQRT